MVRVELSYRYLAEVTDVRTYSVDGQEKKFGREKMQLSKKKGIVP
jgi:ribosomal protein L23